MTVKSERSEPRAPRRSSGDVVVAALGILDRQGLPDLTMRNLAESLGVQASALYWHFPNKQTLLAAVADEIVSRTRTRPVAADDWRDAVHFDAMALHDALLAFKDGAEVVSSALALGLGAREAGRRLAASIERGGFDRMIAERSAEALLHFVIGQTWHEQQRLQADSLGVVVEPFATDPAEASGATPEGPAVFELGVDLFLAGLDAREPAAPSRGAR
ncbi:TetR family transcriptional regulator [Herbiconiux sp. CPCC 205763]|uniref:TetR family transcriptional regulator n=1 Tax=Herbiconiux aconitum TaxID=2970913 RepID=A0ABT2GLS1_9MICO|nr:TetR family transcriptional regulator [Herbiconiux aconitum]MCS5717176.1 TetR family transcriptional regulator [Herbiconiux aconitum]